MKTLASLAVGLMLCSPLVFAGEYLMNDTGEAVTGLRVVFSEPVSITGCGDVLLSVDPQGESIEFIFSGGELEAWEGHWLNWEPATALRVGLEWMTETTLASDSSSPDVQPTGSPFPSAVIASGDGETPGAVVAQKSETQAGFFSWAGSVMASEPKEITVTVADASYVRSSDRVTGSVRLVAQHLESSGWGTAIQALQLTKRSNTYGYFEDAWLPVALEDDKWIGTFTLVPCESLKWLMVCKTSGPYPMFGVSILVGLKQEIAAPSEYVGDRLSWEAIHTDVGKLPEFYTGDATTQMDSYVDLLETIYGKDPGAARWIVDSGLFLEDRSLSNEEIRYARNAAQSCPDVLRDLVRREVLDGIGASERPGNRSFDLGTDLSMLPDVRDGLTQGERQAGSTLQRILERSQEETGRSYELRKGLYLIDEYGIADPAVTTPHAPPYNSQLQALLWLLEETEVPESYWVVALACGLVYGTILTVGDSDVDFAVREYMPAMMQFIIDTDRLLASSGAGWQARDYPLEAAVTLAWGAVGFCPPSVNESDRFCLVQRIPRLMTKREFERFFVSLDSLVEMRDFMLERGFVAGSVTDPCADSDFQRYSARFPGSYDDTIDRTIADLEDCFVHSGPTGELPTVGPRSYLEYVSQKSRIVLEVEGERVYSYRICNPDWQWERFKEVGRIIGISDDYAGVQGMLAKSINIATAIGNMSVSTHGHKFILYYNPYDHVLRTDPYQAEANGFAVGPPPAEFGYVFIPWDNLAFEAPNWPRLLYFYSVASSYVVYGRGIPLGYIWRLLPRSVPY